MPRSALQPFDLKTFGLQDGPDSRRLIALDLDPLVFHGPAAAAGGSDPFRDGFDHGDGQVCAEVFDNDDRFPAAKCGLALERDAAHGPDSLRGFRIALLRRAGREIREV